MSVIFIEDNKSEPLHLSHNNLFTWMKQAKNPGTNLQETYISYNSRPALIISVIFLQVMPRTLWIQVQPWFPIMVEGVTPTVSHNALLFLVYS